MRNDPRSIMPGDFVFAFDLSLYENDKKTPLGITMQKAIVLRRYGIRTERYGIYPDLVDVRFIHNGKESRAHFTTYVKEIR